MSSVIDATPPAVAARNRQPDFARISLREPENDLENSDFPDAGPVPHRIDATHSRPNYVSFLWSQAGIVLENDLVPLISPLELQWDMRSNFLRLAGTSLTTPWNEMPQFSQKLASFVRKLFSAGMSDALSKQEQADWEAIVEHIDYPQLFNVYAGPQYVTGKIERMGDKVITVKVGDRNNLHIARSVAGELCSFTKGDWFEAYCVFNKEGKVKRVERVLPLKPAQHVTFPEHAE